jgi:hypothetical protein
MVLPQVNLSNINFQPFQILHKVKSELCVSNSSTTGSLGEEAVQNCQVQQMKKAISLSIFVPDVIFSNCFLLCPLCAAYAICNPV